MEGMTLQEHFATLEDPRVERTKRHPSTSHHHDCMVRGELRSRHVDVEEFGKSKQAWLETFLE